MGHRPVHRSLATLLLVAMLATSGCAMVFKGTTEPVTFVTEATDVTILVDGVAVGVAPATIPLDTERSHMVTFQKPGHEPLTILVEKELHWGYLVADFLTGVWPIAIDLLAGTLYTFDDDAYMVEY